MTTRPREADIAFEKLSTAGRLRKLQYHLDNGNWPVPASWVRWLLSQTDCATWMRFELRKDERLRQATPDAQTATEEPDGTEDERGNER